MYSKNASSLHRAVGNILRTSDLFRFYEAHQEYPVVLVNPSYPNRKHRYDWVIPKLRLVIECHGIQHKKCSSFGAKAEDAVSAFKDQKIRDLAKERAAIEAGYSFIIIWYNQIDELTDRFIFDQIHMQDTIIESPKKIVSEKHKLTLERAREYRHSQYLRAKEKHAQYRNSAKKYK